MKLSSSVTPILVKSITGFTSTPWGPTRTASPNVAVFDISAAAEAETAGTLP
jgi:hypothetical protein